MRKVLLILLLVPFVLQEVDASTITNGSITEDGRIRDEGNNNICDGIGPNRETGELSISYGTWPVASTIDCDRGYVEWNTSTIPDTAIILDVSMEYWLGGDFACEFRHMATQPTIASDAVLWADMDDGNVYFSAADTFCHDNTGPRVISLGPLAVSDLQTAITGGVNWFGLGITVTDESPAPGPGGDANSFGTEDLPNVQPSVLMVEWSETPDAVDDLIITNLSTSTLDLVWTTPDIGVGTHIGAQINFTTPFGDPLTVITNDTGSTINSVAVSGLNQDTPFSFRVSVWTDGGNNASGNIANATTLQFGNFTVGGIELDAVNLDFRTWVFARTDLNASAFSLSVIYPDTYNATCSFHFKFANIDSIHSNLVTTIPSVDKLEAIFTFNNTADEVIDVLCNDETDPTTPDGRYLLTQADFLLLRQFDQFRDGTFGTMGMFGALDLITLFGIIFATIGFNRINESVGGFFLLVILGVMAFFEIIVWPTALSGAIAVVIMLVVMSTRKV